MTESGYNMTSIQNVRVPLQSHFHESLGGPNMTFKTDQILKMIFAWLLEYLGACRHYGSCWHLDYLSIPEPVCPFRGSYLTVPLAGVLVWRVN